MKTVLFVDDEINVLSGLKRLLYPLKNEWDMHFITSGEEALAYMQAEPVDVLVADLKMPGMSGQDLLRRVKQQHPTTVRVILTGTPDEEQFEKTGALAHQYLSKPCDYSAIESVLQSIAVSETIMRDKELHEIIARIGGLPAVPEAYQIMVEEMRKDSPSLARIAGLIQNNEALCEDILLLANSAHFGLQQRVDNIGQAMKLLGLEIVSSCMLASHLFATFDKHKYPDYSLKLLWEHCLRTSAIAHKLALVEGAGEEVATKAGMAGMLHDLGKLILTTEFHNEYMKVLEAVYEGGMSIRDAENQIIGASHAEIGGFLLSLWGVGQDIVEAVVRHHDVEAAITGPAPSLFVHAANVLEHESYVIHEHYFRSTLDMTRIQQSGASKVTMWREIAVSVAKSSKHEVASQSQTCGMVEDH